MEAASRSRAKIEVASVLESADIPLLLVGADLTLRMFSPGMARIVGLRRLQLGAPLMELPLTGARSVTQVLAEVLQTRETQEQEVQDGAGRWYTLRVGPHRSAGETVGVVLTLVDVDTERVLRQQLLASRDFAACMLQEVPLPIAVLHADLTFRSANTAFQNLAETLLEGASLEDVAWRCWGVGAEAVGLHRLKNLPTDGMVEAEFTTGRPLGKVLLMKGRALTNGAERVLLLMMEDVTLRRETEHRQARQQTALAHEAEHRNTLLKLTQKELHDLAHQLFTVQEQERERIARELHDDVSQRLSLLEMACSSLSWTGRRVDDRREIESLLGQIHSLANDVRTMSHHLHPAVLKHLGLVAALQTLVDAFTDKESLPVTFASTVEGVEISDMASTTCYRIAQEALRNVAKHAGRTPVEVSLETADGWLRLQVRDAGRGFDPAPLVPYRGLGLTSMRERARIAGGSFAMTSRPGAGTVVVAEVPVRGDG